MGKFFLVFLFLLKIIMPVCAQTEKVTDSLLNEVCNSIKSNKLEADSLKVMKAFEKHIFPLFDGLTEQQGDKLYEFVFIRLQRQCKEFSDILQKTTEQQGDWQSVKEKPKLKLDKTACRSFSDRTVYYYLETNGDTVTVKLSQSVWQEKFIDGSYSKLKFYWISDCEFELEFIESNHHIRKNFSRKGDKYRYQLFDKTKNYYSTSVELPDMPGIFETFKLYFD
jgi:hypothetical protein